MVRHEDHDQTEFDVPPVIYLLNFAGEWP